MNKKERKNLPPNQCNYNISLEEIKQYNFWSFIEALGGSLIKKKSSKYGKLYKTEFGSLWIRYDYSTGYFFYVNLTGSDKGTLIDFIQEHILKEKNLGKVRKYFKEKILRQ